MAVPSEGLLLPGFLASPEGRARGSILLLHGFPSGSPPEPDDPGYPGLARELAARGWTALALTFRGAHGAPGRFSPAGWLEDASSGLRWLASRAGRAVVVGSSMGGAVGAAAALRNPREVMGLALLASPATLARFATAERAEPFYARALELGLVEPMEGEELADWARGFALLDAVSALRELAGKPVLVLHGTDDDLVPLAAAEELYRAASGPKDLVVLEGAGHRLRREPRALEALFRWLQGLQGGQAPAPS